MERIATSVYVNYLNKLFYFIILFLIYFNNTGVPKVPPFLEGTSFRDVVECWRFFFLILTLHLGNIRNFKI
jgi:hypothetical protein